MILFKTAVLLVLWQIAGFSGRLKKISIKREQRQIKWKN